MKRSRYSLLAAWLLMFCFIAGQVIVYSHQHHFLKYSHAQHNDADGHCNKAYVTEKCPLCDNMDHSDMVLQHDTYSTILPVELLKHPVLVYEFKSFGLILADGRSPPTA